MALVVSIAHTAQAPAPLLAGARDLLVDAFHHWTDEDWDHCLGGLHAFAHDDDGLVGHGALVQRRLLHAGRALRAGYVEAVAVRADRRRVGIASAIMAELERLARVAYEIAALSASDEGRPFYLGRGWQPWRGRTSALTPTGVLATPEEDDSTFVLPIATDLDLTGELTCDWRDGDVW